MLVCHRVNSDSWRQAKHIIMINYYAHSIFILQLLVSTLSLTRRTSDTSSLRSLDQLKPHMRVVCSTANFSCLKSTQWSHQKCCLELRSTIQTLINSEESVQTSSKTNGLQPFRLELCCCQSRPSSLPQILMIPLTRRSQTIGRKTKMAPQQKQSPGLFSLPVSDKKESKLIHFVSK